MKTVQMVIECRHYLSLVMCFACATWNIKYKHPLLNCVCRHHMSTSSITVTHCLFILTQATFSFSNLHFHTVLWNTSSQPWN